MKRAVLFIFLCAFWLSGCGAPQPMPAVMLAPRWRISNGSKDFSLRSK